MSNRALPASWLACSLSVVCLAACNSSSHPNPQPPDGSHMSEPADAGLSSEPDATATGEMDAATGDAGTQVTWPECNGCTAEAPLSARSPWP